VFAVHKRIFVFKSTFLWHPLTWTERRRVVVSSINRLCGSTAIAGHWKVWNSDADKNLQSMIDQPYGGNESLEKSTLLHEKNDFRKKDGF
jgi:hypothetical protein